MVVASVDRAEQRLKVVPQWLRQHTLRAFLGRALKKLVGKQVGALRERDEQDAVEDFLGELDGDCSIGSFGPASFTGQKGDELAANSFL